MGYLGMCGSKGYDKLCLSHFGLEYAFFYRRYCFIISRTSVFYEPVPLLGTFSNADFCDGESYRKSKLFPVDVLHFAGKPSSLRAEVTAASFPLYKM